jgi:hypothetical protein
MTIRECKVCEDLDECPLGDDCPVADEAAALAAVYVPSGREYDAMKRAATFHDGDVVIVRESAYLTSIMVLCDGKSCQDADGSGWSMFELNGLTTVEFDPMNPPDVIGRVTMIPSEIPVHE